MLSTKILSAMAANVPAADSDPYFSNVSLLLHCDGTNGSQSFVDSSGSPKTITAVGNAQISTTTPKFGTGCALFDGVGDYLSIASPSINLYDWYSTDFTLELFINPTNFTSWYYNLNGLVPIMIGNAGHSYSPNYWSFGIASATGQVRLYYYNGAPVFGPLSTATLTAGQYNYVALKKTSTGYQYQVNNVLSEVHAIVGTPQSASSVPLTIAAGNENYGNGRIDEIRITKGVARNTSVVPVAPFPNQ